MPRFLHLFRCIGNAVCKQGLRGLASLAPMGDVVFDIAADALNEYRGKGTEKELKAEVESVAQASPAEIQKAAQEVAQQVAAKQPLEVRKAVADYLTLVPDAMRQSLRRPADPRGVTVPPNQRIDKPGYLAGMLPGRLPRFKPGDRPLAGAPWQLDKLLGVGGYGEVWKGQHPKLKSIAPVALKFCLDPSAAQTLRNEAALLDRVMEQGQHPGIVPLRQAYLETEPFCLEYEYIDGGDLGGLINELRLKGGLPPPVANRLLLHLARIVGFAHRLNPAVVHRDLKPANILVKRIEGGKVALWVADFGIGGLAASQALGAAASAPEGQKEAEMTAVRGSYTPLYASPQQVEGSDPDPRDDVHALGVIWYQLLTGDLSKTKPSGRGWRRQLQDKGMPAELLELLEACVDDVPDERPADATVLASKFDPTLDARIVDLESLLAPGAAARERVIPVLTLIHFLEQQRDSFQINRRKLQKTYNYRSVRRVNGTRDAAGKLTKPWLKTEDLDESDYVRVQSFDFNRTSAVLNMLLARRVRLVQEVDGKPITEVAGVPLDRLCTFKNYTVASDGELNIQSLQVKISKPELFAKLCAEGVLEKDGRPAANHDADAEYTLRFDQLPMVPPMRQTLDLEALFDELAETKILSSIVAAHLTDESDTLTAEQIEQLKRHYLSKKLHVTFPSVNEHPDLKKAEAEGAVGLRIRYKIELGSRRILNLGKLPSANKFLDRHYVAVDAQDKKVDDLTFEGLFKNSWKIGPKKLSARLKLTAVDDLMKPLFDGWLGLDDHDLTTSILSRVGAEPLANVLEEKRRGRPVRREERLAALVDARTKLDRHEEFLFQEKLSPLVFYIGSTGRLPEGMQSDPLTADELKAKYPILDFSRDEHDGKFYEVGKSIISVRETFEYYSK
jgi:serine/threonine protein kinase